MFGKSSIKKSSQPTLDVSILQELVELDGQYQELFSGGTSFTGNERLPIRLSRSSLTTELSTLSEYDRFGIILTERRAYLMSP